MGESVQTVVVTLGTILLVLFWLLWRNKRTTSTNEAGGNVLVVSAGILLVFTGIFQIGGWAGAGHGPYWPIEVFNFTGGLRSGQSLGMLGGLAVWIGLMVAVCRARSAVSMFVFGFLLFWMSLISVSGAVRSGYMGIVGDRYSPLIYTLRIWTILLMAYLGWLWFLLIFRSKNKRL